MSAKISISLTDVMMNEINKRLDQGSYNSASEVIRAGLRALSREEEEHAERILAIRAKVQESLNDPRPSVPSKEAFERIEKAFKERHSV